MQKYLQDQNPAPIFYGVGSFLCRTLEQAPDNRVDYASILKALSDEFLPDAEKITLVQDNLNSCDPILIIFYSC